MYRRQLSIKVLLISGVIGLLVLSVSCIIASSYLTSQRVLLRHAKDIMENIATFTIHEAQHYLIPTQDAAELTQRLADRDVLSSTNKAGLEQYFFEQLRLHANFAGMYIGSPHGEFLYVSRSDWKVQGGFLTKIITVGSGVKTTELRWKDAAHQELLREFAPHDTYDPTTRPWYGKAVEHRRAVWTEPYIFYTSQQPGVTVSSPMFDASGNVVGVVGVDIEIAQLSLFLAQLKIGKRGRAFILNPQGDVVAFPDLSKLKWPTGEHDGTMRLTQIHELDDLLARKAFAALPHSPGALPMQQSLFGSFRYAGATYHTMFAPFSNPTWQWIIGIYLPEDDYLGPIKRNRRLNIAIMLGVAAVGSVIGWLVVRSIVRPMTALQLEAQAIRHEDLQTTFEKQSFIKEIQATADAFSQMKVALHTFRQRNAVLTQGLQERAEELRVQAIQLRATLTSLVNFSDALIVLDDAAHMQFLNPAAEALLGVQAARVLGQPLPFPVVRSQTTDVAIASAETAAIIAEMQVMDTEWEGQAALLVSLRDVTARKRLEAAQRQLLDETARLYRQAEDDAHTKTVLLQEVNHRVKNNLSAIIGLLYAERHHSRARHDPVLQSVMADLISRVHGLATVHELLSASGWSPVCVRAVVERIIAAALQALPLHKQVSVQVESAPLRVSPLQANSLAMVVNEMTTNTMKYALQHQDTGRIMVSVALQAGERMARLEFRDNGPGYPANVLTGEHANTGLHLLHTLVHDDLRGELQLANESGAVTVVYFPMAEPAPGDEHA